MELSLRDLDLPRRSLFRVSGSRLAHPGFLRPTALALIVALLSAACDIVSPPEPTPTATAVPATATPPPPTATPTVTPTATPEPTPTPVLQPGGAIVVGGTVRTRAEPNTSSAQRGILGDQQHVTIVGSVEGENWLLGTQTWVSTTPAWARLWYQLEDGSYVYGAFVFILGDNEVSPLAEVPEGVEKWIDVDISEQRARAMVGEEAVFTAAISTGASPFETPKGSFAVEPDGRVAVERMTSSQAGYDESQATYDVERVLFTQYFDRNGNALHLNYWRPDSVFGNVPTSHGCVGMQLHEAQYFWLFAEAGTRVEIHD